MQPALAAAVVAAVLFSSVAARNLVSGPQIDSLVHQVLAQKSIPFRPSHKLSPGGLALLPTNSSALTLVGYVSIGTPPQEFQVQFDTGSTVSWVRSTACRNSEGCLPGDISFNPTASSTYKAGNSTQSIIYGDGTRVNCRIVHDVIAVAGVQLKSNNICIATEITIPTGSSSLDGLFGLAPPKQEDPTAFYKTLKESFNSTQVSFWYNLATLQSDQEEDAIAGEITFGGRNPSRFVNDTTIWLPTTVNATFWNVAFNSMQYGNVTLQITDAMRHSAILDTGTTLLNLPAAIFDIVNKMMGGKLNQYGLYELDCRKVTSLPNVTFSLAGHDFQLTYQDLVLTDSETCVSIFGRTPDTFTVFGSVFLKKYYITFDLAGSVGFAQRTGDVLPLFIPQSSPSSPSNSTNVPSNSAVHIDSRGFSLILSCIAVWLISFFG